jgi:hypothetical protein
MFYIKISKIFYLCVYHIHIYRNLFIYRNHFPVQNIYLLHPEGIGEEDTQLDPI